ncbi:hypothetical protein IMSAGC011_01842 [Lachnospiraceae bacterium]|nr:hypothetical protein IMSAGC011_01842 [Lachnospiraceae bacterium]
MKEFYVLFFTNFIWCAILEKSEGKSGGQADGFIRT